MLFLFSFFWAQCDLTTWQATFPDWPNSLNIIDLVSIFPSGDDLCNLSDEFEDPMSLLDWQRVWQVEGWPGDQLELFDVDNVNPGFMTLMPYTSSWYQDLRGVLAFKLVSDDYVVTTEFIPTDRTLSGAPGRLYSLGGIFMRGPRDVTPATWTPGGENYIFLSGGSASEPGTFQYEVKTTENSNSVLNISYVCSTEPNQQCSQQPIMTLRAARLEQNHFILLRREEGAWVIHRRYFRNDLPSTLQVGFTVYTDWQTIVDRGYFPNDPFGHNNTVITDGNPDLYVQVDYMRYQRPVIPIEHQGKNFSAPYNPGDPTTISDADLLDFLGF